MYRTLAHLRFHVWTTVFAICVFPLCPLALEAHDDPSDEPHTHASGEHIHEEGASEPQIIGPALVLPQIEGPKPWSNKPALTDPHRFSIAIMTDRTGGHRPGIWMKAVERINWLRPEFVVSVGDLIEGYTEDETEIATQWKEFLGFIDQMQMKFFFVAGNHDVTNPVLHRIWREKFGPEWYSFDYQGVHFVCLSSEDPSAHLGDKQLSWLEEDLSQHRDARWTLVFLHKPIWVYAEREAAAGNPDPTNWNRAAKMLVDRPHTVFAGHVHHYVQYQRNGQQYYSLATTGGSSQLRGLPYGEFDHITWLTMEQDGPHVANLLLDGIQPAGIVTEESIEGFHEFLEGVHIDVEPILISEDALRRGEIRLNVQNDYLSPVSIEAKIEGLPLVGLNMESQQIQLSAEAGQVTRQVIPFSMSEDVELSRFRLTTLTATVTSDDKPLKAEWTVPVIVDHQFEIRPLTAALDGRLDEWNSATWWNTKESPMLAGNVEDWTGNADGSFSLAAGFDAERIYVAAKIMDEKIIDGDSFSVIIDPRPLLSRLATNRLGRESIAVTVQAPSSEEVTACSVAAPGRRESRSSQYQAFGRRVKQGYELEISMPIANLVEAQGADWANFQVGARMGDVDTQEDKSLEVLWRASPDRTANRGFAHVIRK